MEIICALLEIWTEIHQKAGSDPELGFIIDEPMRFEYLR